MTMNLFNLDGQVAAVIGATGTLGGAIAEGLAAAGAAVALLGRNATRGRERVAAIRGVGHRAEFFACDAGDRGRLESAHRAITASLGLPTILVNAAGGNSPGATITEEQPFSDLPMDEWRQNVDLNLVSGVLLPCQVFAPPMLKAGRGSIINLASVAGHVPLSRVVAYSAAKAAVLSVTRFLAREWAPRGVRVNSITPGFFPAEQNRRLLFTEAGTPTARAAAILAHTPMGRFGEPHEVVGAVVFLACGAASGFVTGADIRVDGGFLAQTI
jgi:NAD(P)-dependent dehydrogenase (short-subunit alcohol dehydrogenase family)